MATVLVVDDEIAKAQVLSVTFKLAGFRASFVGSAEQALSALEAYPVDAVISDFKMPGVNGVDLLRRVRRDHPWLAFILMTELQDAHIGIQCVKDGADDHLIKPIQANDLLKNRKRPVPTVCTPTK